MNNLEELNRQNQKRMQERGKQMHERLRKDPPKKLNIIAKIAADPVRLSQCLDLFDELDEILSGKHMGRLV